MGLSNRLTDELTFLISEKIDYGLASLRSPIIGTKTCFGQVLAAGSDMIIYHSEQVMKGASAPDVW